MDYMKRHSSGYYTLYPQSGKEYTETAGEIIIDADQDFYCLFNIVELRKATLQIIYSSIDVSTDVTILQSADGSNYSSIKTTGNIDFDEEITGSDNIIVNLYDPAPGWYKVNFSDGGNSAGTVKVVYLQGE